MASELLFAGGTVVPCEPGAPDAEALLVRDGLIADVGTEEALARAAPQAARVELGGGALLPGFIDPHHHFSLAAFDRRSPDLHLPPGAHVADVLAAVAAHAAQVSGPGWLRLQGYDPSRLRERRAPTRDELDQACPDRPLLLIAYSFHDGVLNSAGLDALGWHEGSPDPPGGALLRRRGRGLTGEVSEAAFFLAEARSRSDLPAGRDDLWIAELHEHGRALLRSGIVRVADAAVDPAVDRLYERAAESGLLPLTVHRMPVGRGSLLEARLDAEPTGQGNARTPAGAAKLFLDGADRCAMCATAPDLARSALRVLRVASGEGMAAVRAASRASGGWRRGHDGHFHRGVRFWDDRALSATIAQAAGAGLQVAQHALGNEAVAQALDALDRHGAALARLPGRPRLEHAMFLDAALERRIAASGAAAVVQPLFIRELGDDLRLVPLPGRLRVLDLRSLIDAGALVSGSSDYPVEDFAPLPAMQAAITRRTRAGALFSPDAALAVDEALALYTRNAAAALGVDDVAGSLVPGKRADLVMLDADPRAVAPDRLGSLAVRAVYVGGELAA